VTPRQIIEALGVPFVVSSIEPRRDSKIGYAPTSQACLFRQEGVVTVWADRNCYTSLVLAVHEALHAVVGPFSFACEAKSGLMALEWAVCQELDPNPYALWRRDFADYGLHGENFDEIGPTDAFLACEEWRAIEANAEARGLLVPHRRPVWGSGPADFSG